MANKKISSIRYSLVPRLSNPTDKNSEKKIFATLQQRETVGLKKLSRHVKAHGSSFSVGTIIGVLNDMVECIVEMLQEGYSVNLEGLARFYLTATSEGVDSVEDFSPNAHIRHLNIRADIDNEADAAVNTSVDYEYSMTRKAEAEAKRAHKEEVQDELGGTSGGDDDNGEVTE